MTIRGNMTALGNLGANWNKMTHEQQKDMIRKLLQYQMMQETQQKKESSVIESTGVNMVH